MDSGIGGLYMFDKVIMAELDMKRTKEKSTIKVWNIYDHYKKWLLKSSKNSSKET